MNDKPHHHPCRICGVKVPCDGDLEQNHDGWPEVVCRLYHIDDVEALCEDCHNKEFDALASAWMAEGRFDE